MEREKDGSFSWGSGWKVEGVGERGEAEGEELGWVKEKVEFKEKYHEFLCIFYFNIYFYFIVIFI